MLEQPIVLEKIFHGGHIVHFNMGKECEAEDLARLRRKGEHKI